MTLPADSTEIEKAWDALNYKNLDGLDDFDFFAVGYAAARASTIEECARAAEALAHGFNMGRLFTRDPAMACEDCAATLRALASADPSPDPLMRKEPE